MLESAALMSLLSSLPVSLSLYLALGLNPCYSSVSSVYVVSVAVRISLYYTNMYRVCLPYNKNYHVSFLFHVFACMHVLYLLFTSGCMLNVSL